MQVPLTTCLHAVESRLRELRRVQHDRQPSSHVNKLVLSYLVGVNEAERESARIAIAREQKRFSVSAEPKHRASGLQPERIDRNPREGSDQPER